MSKTLSALVILLGVVLGGARAAAAGGEGGSNATRYGFYRGMGGAGGGAGGGGAGGAGGTRRVFGGAAVPLGSYPAACALLDRYWAARCSGAVVAARWALTAAHCVTPRVSYVKYNTRRPASPDGDVSPVHFLYRHPKYRVVQQDEGRGVDVTLLHHDVGLVRTRDDMTLAAALRSDPLVAMRRYDPVDLRNEEVEVVGFGRTERSSLGEELFAVRLQLVACGRGAWRHVACGVAARGAARGVCAGDSGGPVLYRGAQVGVTSLGPLQCAAPAAAAAAPPEGATSVFTTLHPYADLLDATIHDTEAALRMRRISAAPPPPAPRHPPLLALGAATALFLVFE